LLRLHAQVAGCVARIAGRDDFPQVPALAGIECAGGRAAPGRDADQEVGRSAAAAELMREPEAVPERVWVRSGRLRV